MQLMDLAWQVHLGPSSFPLPPKVIDTLDDTNIFLTSPHHYSWKPCTPVSFAIMSNSD
ncbi:hypothetical protein SNOG_11518 [Parastagonospora nodorum SN15]|uniref:Uncharacterized protein n=1 Tax=Phaeosphaeria nodorum (strain SN15 / ATCC MYA-4574 / FGSC 10173) TaxID=321614 RepID=Q0U9P6_PHANO|nr:hypothetical protein SNOG_11518 [Parastagonospora nodorum SN15]EAT81226.1 hypothetical protein SNOG_11518 [Parastagonospora nodorum SN15]